MLGYHEISDNELKAFGVDYNVKGKSAYEIYQLLKKLLEENKISGTEYGTIHVKTEKVAVGKICPYIALNDNFAVYYDSYSINWRGDNDGDSWAMQYMPNTGRFELTLYYNYESIATFTYSDDNSNIFTINNLVKYDIEKGLTAILITSSYNRG